MKDIIQKSKMSLPGAAELLFSLMVVVFTISSAQSNKDLLEFDSKKNIKSVQNLRQNDLTITLDAAVMGQPISPYTYGEFIEHQGRCIYGGIWSEMIKDRKFYYLVNTSFIGDPNDKSPWHATSIGTVVEMDTIHVFVGRHSPHIYLDGQIPGGIEQDNLALRQGKSYTGRIILSGSDSIVVKVSLIWGSEPNDRQTIIISKLSQGYAPTPLQFNVTDNTDNGRLEIIGEGKGSFYVGTVSLMPADNIQGMRADVINLLKELNATVYRWPGGSFVNGYNWRLAIGDRDKRIPIINHSYWSEQIESNDFGPDEFMLMVRTLGAQPYIAVSAMNNGDEQMAAEEVEYLNGASNTPMGNIRAMNGHPLPYSVRFWGVGNEAYFFAALNEYVNMHKQITQAMRNVDSTITIIAVGGLGEEGIVKGQGDWSQVMLTQAANYMNLISEHDYGPPKDDLIQHSRSIAERVNIFAEAHRKFREKLPSLQGKDIRLALDELNYFWGNKPYLYGEAGVRYYFKDALGMAIGYHEIYRNSDLIFMANTHPVNVLGHIKTTDADAAFEVTALPLIVYRNHFGVLPLTVNGNLDTLDVAAAWSSDRKFLTVAVVNPTQQSHTLTLDLKNAQLTSAGRWWRIASSDPLAYNEPGKPPNVIIEEGSQSGVSSILNVSPLSIILYELPAKPEQLSEIFKFERTIQVTPDTNFKTGGFVRINYVPANDRFIVTFATQLDKPSGGCTGSGYAFREYTTDMQETSKSGVFSCELFDSGSRMIDNTYYFVSMHKRVDQSTGWRIVKYDATNWKTLADIFLPLDYPREQNGDPMVAYVNGQLDISGQYNASGNYPDLMVGAATFHYFFSLNLDSLGKKILTDVPHIVGSSMIYVDSVYYFITANAFLGDLVLMKYDKNWKYLGMKVLRQQAHFSTGVVFDGQRFYLSYLNTSQRATPTSLPVYLNVRLAAFDRDWNLIEDYAVTNYTPFDLKQPGRPWVILHKNRLYVSYDLDTRDSSTGEEQLKGQAIVSIYELTPGSSSIKQTEEVPAEFRLEQNYPNPFNSATKIMFSLTARQTVTLKIYDILGREVTVLLNEVKQPGRYAINFDAKDMSSGLYFYILKAGEFIATKKLIVLK